MNRVRGGGWRPSRIGPRLLAFNLLVVFVPVVGVLYLDVYEVRLLEAQEREMVQQARVVAAILGETAAIDVPLIERMFARLERRTEARVRVFDPYGVLVADSGRMGAPAAPESADSYSSRSDPPPSTIRQRILYRLGAAAARVRERLTKRVRSWLNGRDNPNPAETSAADPAVSQALSGRYGASTRPTPGQRSLTLVSAVPVRHEGTIIGAVAVSQSTFRILNALYQVRLRIFEIVMMSVVAAAFLTALAATTIVRPLKRLRTQASALAERRAPLGTAFPATDRRDEIGALARALEQLTGRLDDQIKRLESFAADVAHEFRNPLASIRAAAETLEDTEDPAERSRFLAMMHRDVDRLDRLVAGVREVALIDRQLEQEALAIVELGPLLEDVIERARLTTAGCADVSITGHRAACRVRGRAERLAQAFENLLSNALSFAPPNSAVEVTVTFRESRCCVEIADRGPGIPDAHLTRVFERFFSYRPGQPRRDHVGLGLAIARQIIDSYGGRVTAKNRTDGGAVFEVQLPASS